MVSVSSLLAREARLIQNDALVYCIVWSQMASGHTADRDGKARGPRVSYKATRQEVSLVAVRIYHGPTQDDNAQKK